MHASRLLSSLEVAEQILERWINARFRHQTFVTLTSLNQAVRQMLNDVNQLLIKKHPSTRRSHFDQLDKPVINGLLSPSAQHTRREKAQVHIDKQIECDNHYHSVRNIWPSGKPKFRPPIAPWRFSLSVIGSPAIRIVIFKVATAPGRGYHIPIKLCSRTASWTRPALRRMK